MAISWNYLGRECTENCEKSQYAVFHLSNMVLNRTFYRGIATVEVRWQQPSNRTVNSNLYTS